MTLQQSISPAIFRAYDIRGVVGDTLTVETVRAIGQAIGTVALAAGEKAIVVGRDGRLSGPMLVVALCEGILASGCDVIDLGVVPTPVLYYATHTLTTRSGVMLTGSHNPPDYNGLKIVIQGKTLAEEGIRELYQRIIECRLSAGQGARTEMAIVETYIDHIVRTVPLAKPLKVVVDCGNGVPGGVVPTLYRRLGCEVIELFCEVDGHFPNHHPDPSQAHNLQDLLQAVRLHDADVGLAFDGDGDRLGVVTRKGDIIWPDRQLMLFAKALLAKQPGATIIYDVKCSNHLATVIREHGGIPLMWKTGHSLIKSKLAETGALLAGEMSGHIFIKDRWFGFDDALYAGVRLLEILAAETVDSDAVFATIPDSVNTPELKINVSEEAKFLIMDKLIANANFTMAEVVTIDGLRVNFADGWGLIRPSNTTPCLVLRFEAVTEAVLARIQQIFRDFILAVEPGLVLPF
jgi:phosphomannomutase/phosphoglucomutase